jgi:hypothetical protein
MYSWMQERSKAEARPAHRGGDNEEEVENRTRYIICRGINIYDSGAYIVCDARHELGIRRDTIRIGIG